MVGLRYDWEGILKNLGMSREVIEDLISKIHDEIDWHVEELLKRG
jgi:hypothetical protein